MLKRILCLLALTVFFFAIRNDNHSHAHHLSDNPRFRKCHSIRWERGPRHVRALITCAARVWKSPYGPAYAVYVADCESNLNPRATNGPFRGVYQQHSSYWRARVERYAAPLNSTSIFNAEVNIIVSLRMAVESGWGPWPVCSRVAMSRLL